LITKSLSLNNF